MEPFDNLAKKLCNILVGTERLSLIGRESCQAPSMQLGMSRLTNWRDLSFEVIPFSSCVAIPSKRLPTPHPLKDALPLPKRSGLESPEKGLLGSGRGGGGEMKKGAARLRTTSVSTFHQKSQKHVTSS